MSSSRYAECGGVRGVPREPWRSLHVRVDGLDYLEYKEIEIVRLGHTPEDRVVGGLLALLDLPQANSRIVCRLRDGSAE